MLRDHGFGSSTASTKAYVVTVEFWVVVKYDSLSSLFSSVTSECRTMRRFQQPVLFVHDPCFDPWVHHYIQFNLVFLITEGADL